MEKELLHGQMEIFTVEILLMILNMDMVYFHEIMEENIKDNGLIISNMEKDNIIV